MFTDFTASNIGTPPIRRLPYYVEHNRTRWDMSQSGGIVVIDGGRGNFLTKGICSAALRGRFAMAHAGTGQPSALSGAALRNVDRRPYPTLSSLWTQRLLHPASSHRGIL